MDLAFSASTQTDYTPANQMRTCPDCATEYPEDLDSCPECGAAPVLNRCRRCGEEYGDLDACPACGRARVDFPCDSHPLSRAAGRCVICARAVCRECEAGDGRVHICEEHAGTTVIQGWAQVYSTSSEVDAQLVSENLVAEGIETRVFSQKDNMLSVDLGDLSIVRLLVPAWDFQQAQTIIQQHMDRRGEVTFACPACGEAYEPGTEVCASCGEPLTVSGR